MDISRHVKESLNAEIEPYRYRGAIIDFKPDNDKVRARICFRGKSQVVYYPRYTARMHVVKSIVSEVRRKMHALGIIVDHREKIGGLGEAMIEAAKKHNGNGSHPIPVKPVPPPEHHTARQGRESPKGSGGDLNSGVGSCIEALIVTPSWSPSSNVYHPTKR